MRKAPVGNPMFILIHFTDATRAVQKQSSAWAPRLLTILQKKGLGQFFPSEGWSEHILAPASFAVWMYCCPWMGICPLEPLPSVS